MNFESLKCLPLKDFEVFWLSDYASIRQLLLRLPSKLLNCLPLAAFITVCSKLSLRVTVNWPHDLGTSVGDFTVDAALTYSFVLIIIDPKDSATTITIAN